MFLDLDTQCKELTEKVLALQASNGRIRDNSDSSYELSRAKYFPNPTDTYLKDIKQINNLHTNEPYHKIQQKHSEFTKINPMMIIYINILSKVLPINKI